MSLADLGCVPKPASPCSLFKVFRPGKAALAWLRPHNLRVESSQNRVQGRRHRAFSLLFVAHARANCPSERSSDHSLTALCLSILGSEAVFPAEAPFLKMRGAKRRKCVSESQTSKPLSFVPCTSQGCGSWTPGTWHFGRKRCRECIKDGSQIDA
jgi:hypothetical protein